MPNPRVTVILTSELVSLLNEELEKNPWSEGPKVLPGVIRKPRSMSEVIASAALKGLASNGERVLPSNGHTVGSSDGGTVGASDTFDYNAMTCAWVGWATPLVRGTSTPSADDMTREAQEGFREVLDRRLGELGTWMTWAATRAPSGSTGEELREALDERLGALRELARETLAGYSDKWSEEKVLSEVRDALGAERLEESVWVVWAEKVLGVGDGAMTTEELRDHVASELLELRKSDLDQKVALRLTSLELEGWLEWSRERLGVEGHTSEELRDRLSGLLPIEDNLVELEKWVTWAAGVLKSDLEWGEDESAKVSPELRAALDKLLEGLGKIPEVDPRLADAPSWLTPERAITCLLDVVANPEAMVKLEAGSRKRHPEWF